MTATRKYPKASDKNIKFLTAEQRNLLVQTALHVITHKIPPLRMEYYVRSEDLGSVDVSETHHAVNECGASCCLMGLAAYINADNGGIVIKHELWNSFGHRALGVSNDHHKNGKFMFDGNWSNSRKQAAARVLLWLRGQDVCFLDLSPTYYCEKEHREMRRETYLTSYSVPQLVRALKEFLVEE